AMQDLDIRGAGNLLGAEQSGFIADLGYETYQRILKEAVIELKTEEFGDTFTDTAAGKEDEYVSDCLIESDLQLMLPAAYVPTESERIALYQQLDNMETPAQTDTFRASLLDRFGPIPETAEELIRIVPLRRLAITLGIERINLRGGKMYLYFTGRDNKAYYQSAAFGRMVTYMQMNFRRVTVRDNNGKRSMIINDVPTVRAALELLTTIRALPAT
ncbi:MAG: transcription-repair coupling factor, partial [Muribaculaceae bacterium]|nr:transcription-repair coupling factor [Muribaculaceae bacterium]